MPAQRQRLRGYWFSQRQTVIEMPRRHRSAKGGRRRRDVLLHVGLRCLPQPIHHFLLTLRKPPARRQTSSASKPSAPNLQRQTFSAKPSATFFRGTTICRFLPPSTNCRLLQVLGGAQELLVTAMELPVAVAGLTLKSGSGYPALKCWSS
jgi:hypothetical protein